MTSLHNMALKFDSQHAQQLQLSADRRVLDEALAAQYLQAFQKYLQQPTLMLL